MQNDLQIESAEFISDVKVFDISGKLLIQESANTNQYSLPTAELSSGIYLLRIQTSEGLQNFKITKE